MTVTTLRTEPLVAPDRDWETLRASAMAALGATAPDWTDHNVSDPGVTIAEAVAWGLADLHYRTGNAPDDGWSAETGLWRDAGDRHWSGAPLPVEHQRLRALADALAGLAAPVVRGVRAAAEPGEAVALLVTAEVPADVAAAAARLLRAPYVLRAALDGGAAVEAVRRSPDEAAVALLRLDPAFDRLWDVELRAVLRRARRRAVARDIRRRTAELRRVVGAATTTTAAEAGVTALLAPGHVTDDGLPGVTAEQVRDALAVHPAPPAVRPEYWETPTGRTTAWPPHPLQARTVEPVTADDYARLALNAPGVRRAWVVPEVLPGVGWDGRRVTARAQRLGALTLLVEPEEGVLPEEPTPARRDNFLRGVLEAAIGDEVGRPYQQLQTDLTRRGPRRVLCDEVGAALLGRCPVTLRGVLHVAATADRDDTLEAALERVAALFRAGRPESAPGAAPDPEWPRDIEGPWPPPPPVEGGWRPGDPVRVTELVQALSRDPEVLGVEALEARAGGAWESYELRLDPQCVPVLAEGQCVGVRLDLVEGCGGDC